MNLNLTSGSRRGGGILRTGNRGRASPTLRGDSPARRPSPQPSRPSQPLPAARASSQPRPQRLPPPGPGASSGPPPPPPSATRGFRHRSPSPGPAAPMSPNQLALQKQYELQQQQQKERRSHHVHFKRPPFLASRGTSNGNAQNTTAHAHSHAAHNPQSGTSSSQSSSASSAPPMDGEPAVPVNLTEQRIRSWKNDNAAASFTATPAKTPSDKTASSRGVTELLLLLESNQWARAAQRATSHPHEVRQLVKLRKTTRAVLPADGLVDSRRYRTWKRGAEEGVTISHVKCKALHHACQKLRSVHARIYSAGYDGGGGSGEEEDERDGRGYGTAHRQVIEEDEYIEACKCILTLIRIHPEACKERESRHGCLPLHLAVFSMCATPPPPPETEPDGEGDGDGDATEPGTEKGTGTVADGGGTRPLRPRVDRANNISNNNHHSNSNNNQPHHRNTPSNDDFSMGNMSAMMQQESEHQKALEDTIGERLDDMEMILLDLERQMEHQHNKRGRKKDKGKDKQTSNDTSEGTDRDDRTDRANRILSPSAVGMACDADGMPASSYATDVNDPSNRSPKGRTRTRETTRQAMDSLEERSKETDSRVSFEERGPREGCGAGTPNDDGDLVAENSYDYDYDYDNYHRERGDGSDGHVVETKAKSKATASTPRTANGAPTSSPQAQAFDFFKNAITTISNNISPTNGAGILTGGFGGSSNGGVPNDNHSGSGGGNATSPNCNQHSTNNPAKRDKLPPHSQHPRRTTPSHKELQRRYLQINNQRREEYSVRVIDALLDAWPRGVKTVSEGGRLPLHMACFGKATVKAMETVLHAYPDAARQRNADGFLPIHIAAHWGVSHPDVAPLILKAYPDGAVGRNRWERTPIEEALGMAGENGREYQMSLVWALRRHPTYWINNDIATMLLPRNVRNAPWRLVEAGELPGVTTAGGLGGMVPGVADVGGAGVGGGGVGGLARGSSGEGAVDVDEVGSSDDESDEGFEVQERPSASQLPSSHHIYHHHSNPKQTIALAESTDLSLLITRDKHWEAATLRCRNHPEEARVNLEVKIRGAYNAKITPLHYACEQNPTVEVIQALLRAYPAATQRRQEPGGQLPLHSACTWGASAEVVRALLSVSPQSAEACDFLSNLPLHCACYSGANTDVVRVLVGVYPQSVWPRNHQGSSAMDIVKRLSHPNRREVMGILEKTMSSLLASKKKDEDKDEEGVEVNEDNGLMWV